jgi:hypothetical protein
MAFSNLQPGVALFDAAAGVFPAIFESANGWKSAKILADRQGRGQWGERQRLCEPVNLSQHEPSPAPASFASRCRHRFGTPA